MKDRTWRDVANDAATRGALAATGFDPDTVLQVIAEARDEPDSLPPDIQYHLNCIGVILGLDRDQLLEFLAGGLERAAD